jgi:HB1, ASXL, restriction endonuclease HTH domain
MNWNRRRSHLKELMVRVLTDSQRPMPLSEITRAIKSSFPEAMTGKTPEKSLYSVVYRSEKRRIEKKLEPLFIKEYVKGDCFYSLKSSQTTAKLKVAGERNKE